jgi:hypothetical protein
MHIGHYSEHIRSTSDIVCGRRAFNQLIQSGVANWMRSITCNTTRPCCDLDYLGGDGTLIGIPTSNIDKSVKPVWDPGLEGIRKSSISWNRVERHTFPDLVDNPDIANSVLEVMKSGTESNCSDVQRFVLANQLINVSGSETLNSVIAEFIRWTKLSITSPQFVALRTIFRCIQSRDSVTGAFPMPMCEQIVQSERDLANPRVAARCFSSLSINAEFHSQGLGPEILKVLDDQIKSFGRVLVTTIQMLRSIGTQSQSYFIRMHCLIKIQLI